MIINSAMVGRTIIKVELTDDNNDPDYHIPKEMRLWLSESEFITIVAGFKNHKEFAQISLTSLKEGNRAVILELHQT